MASKKPLRASTLPGQIKEEDIAQAMKERQCQLRQKRAGQRSGANYTSSQGEELMPGYNENGYSLVPTEDEANCVDEHGNAVPRPPWWRLEGRTLIEGSGFQGVMGGLILANAAVIGLETDLNWWPYWDDVENFFLFCFLAELLIKMIALGLKSFFDPSNEDISWNCFDFFVVSLGMVDLIMTSLGATGTGSSATLFRIIRLLRTLRIIRLVKFLKQLYLLAFGLAEAAQAVFWVTILMTFVLYVCAIIMVKTVGRPSHDDDNYDFIMYHFGSVINSMLTLFEIMSAPNFAQFQDQDGLLSARPLLAVFLIAFIIFGSFGMIALLTGVISESMFEKNQLRHEEERLENEAVRDRMLSQLGALFDDLEKNAVGEADEQDVVALVPRICTLFEDNLVSFLKVDIRSAIDLMDTRESGKITKDQFIHGLVMLSEGVRPIAIQEAHFDIAICRKSVEELSLRNERLEQKLHGMDEILLHNERVEKMLSALLLHFGLRESMISNTSFEPELHAITSLGSYGGHSSKLAGMPSPLGVTKMLSLPEEEVPVGHEMASLSGTRMYHPICFDEGVKQFHDQIYQLSSIPDELRGSTLFQGPCRHHVGDEITFTAPVSSTVFVCVSSGGHKDEAQKLDEYLRSMAGWSSFECDMQTSSFSKPGFRVYRKTLNTGTLRLTLKGKVEMSIAIRVPLVEPLSEPDNAGETQQGDSPKTVVDGNWYPNQDGKLESGGFVGACAKRETRTMDGFTVRSKI